MDAFPKDVVVADFLFQSGQCREVVDGEARVAQQSVEHYGMEFLDVGAHEIFNFWVHVGVPDCT